METNFIFLSDSYKYTHDSMLLSNTDGVYSYFEARQGSQFDTTTFYGLQYLIKKHLTGPVITKDVIDEAEDLINDHFGMKLFNRDGWEYILYKYDGCLPLRIKAVKEGSKIPINNVLMDVENLGGKKTAFLTNFTETVLTHVWYPTTVATLSGAGKNLLRKYLEETCSETGDILNGILEFQLHDFGCRGTETMEASAIGGSAHLLNFNGTDTIPALRIPSGYYNSKPKELFGWSVRATEHSIMTSRGEEGEFTVVEELLEKNPTGILAMVIDSYNYVRFLETCGTKYKEKILNRDGRIVFRPDSGDIIKVSQNCLELLGKHFGYSVNNKGYKVLPNQVRVLWGDGIDLTGIDTILKVSKQNGWSSENWVFGMGGGLLQKINRDNCRFAFKCSSQLYDGAWHDVQKIPLDKSKASKAGRLALIKLPDGSYKTIREEELIKPEDNLLETVFECGKLIRSQSFTDIRSLARS